MPDGGVDQNQSQRNGPDGEADVEQQKIAAGERRIGAAQGEQVPNDQQNAQLGWAEVPVGQVKRSDGEVAR